jgi:hypothetical protein
MATLTKQEIINQRKKCQEQVFRLQEQKLEDLEEHKITVDEFDQITARQGAIQNKINELNVLMIETGINEITIGDDSPGTRLKASVSQLENAINELDKMRDFLNSVASVIKSLSAIIGALDAVLP